MRWVAGEKRCFVGNKAAATKKLAAEQKSTGKNPPTEGKAPAAYTGTITYATKIKSSWAAYFE